jgi:hypothetical protein
MLAQSAHAILFSAITQPQMFLLIFPFRAQVPFHGYFNTSNLNGIVFAFIKICVLYNNIQHKPPFAQSAHATICSAITQPLATL